MSELPSEPETIFPKIDVVPGLGFMKRIGGVLIKWVYFLPTDEPFESMSDHYRGAAHMLDEHLDD
jgi:hypothetical protein